MHVVVERRKGWKQGIEIKTQKKTTLDQEIFVVKNLSKKFPDEN